jgi:hypothetical protein
VATMLKALSLYCSVDRKYVADNTATSRVDARAVVLRMRSSFHKRDAMVKVKKYLATNQVREACVRDCFPSAAMEIARNLKRFGGHLRRTQGYQRLLLTGTAIQFSRWPSMALATRTTPSPRKRCRPSLLSWALPQLLSLGPLPRGNQALAIGPRIGLHRAMLLLRLSLWPI